MASSDIPFVGAAINKLFGSRNERVVRKYHDRAAQVNARDEQTRTLTDAQLRDKTNEFKQRFKDGEKWDQLFPDVMAVAREAMDRNIGIRNIFNPDHADAFPLDKLPTHARKLYDQTKAQMDAATPMEPVGDLRGHHEAVQPWQYIDIPTDLYNAVRELFPKSKPPFRSRPFDVQLIGANVLYQGSIAEMKTGEGKTIVAPLAAYLAICEGYKVHVVTVNDYLVQRDRDWVFPFFRALGLTVGAIHPQHTQPESVKRIMYTCDCVYGTTAEFGFDFLRDNMKKSAEQQVQRYREFAIVDEVDSVLIDEARTPLIISGQAHEGQPRYDLAESVARHLTQVNKPWADADEIVENCKKRIKGLEGDIRNARDKAQIPEIQAKLKDAKAQLPDLESARDKHTQYFEVLKDKKRANLTHHGIAEAQKHLGLGSLYVGDNTDLPHLIENAIKAHAIYTRDEDYVVMPVPDQMTGRNDPDVVIVDSNTGRAMVGRQWSDGLHQAVQAKEGLKIKAETQTVASITIQNFFKMYKRLAGMTGTADTEAQEFYDIYGLDVVTIPTNVPVIRADHNDTVYLSQKDKWNAIADEIKAMHDIGRPVLVGTTSVDKSELVAKMLTQRHAIKHEVLNAKQHEREADIVAEAGQIGAVMIATNMAGRGTDIKLKPISRQQLIDHWKRRNIAPADLSPEDDTQTLRAKVYRKVAQKELNIPKREAEAADPIQLELDLLRHWTAEHTWTDPKKAATMSAQECRDALDKEGRFALHNIDWYDNINDLGGLHVIGTERHDSRRIDNQLRGRSGRQGDNGSTRFFVSLDDDLMKLFAGETTMKLLARMGMKEGDAIEHPMLTKSIERAQRKVEERNFQMRKNILEYDEVMEHQRQEFYGLRQRVIDGLDLKGLVLDFIADAAEANTDQFLAKDYFAEQAAEFASDKLGVSIPPERLKSKDKQEAEDTVKRIALEEAGHEIEITIGEYMPGEADLVDIDDKGLKSWAEERFSVEITTEDIQTLGERGIKAKLRDAAEHRIEGTSLAGIEVYLDKLYGEAKLSEWLKQTLALDLPAEKIAEFETRDELISHILKKVKEAYDNREVTYPVDFVMQMTQQLMSVDTQRAAENLVNWANARFDLGWDTSIVQTTPPNEVAQTLVNESRAFLDSGKLEDEINKALEYKTADDLARYIKDRYDRELPFWVARLKPDELEGHTRAMIESIYRTELVQLERFILLETLDPAWKEHLYNMDQLRDTIGFRAFSQQDPRIEYKREGARQFTEMMNSLHDRVAELVFRARLNPQIAPPRQPQQPQRPPQGGQLPGAPSQQSGPLGGAGSGIFGPGFQG